MKIIYVHGLGSGANSSTGELLKEVFPEHEVICAEMPIEPFKAYMYLKDLVIRERPNLLIGTSLGGFYAMLIAGPKKLLINPALKASEAIKDVIGLGEYDYHCARMDGAEKYLVNEKMIEELAALEKTFYEKLLDMEVKSETFAIFGDSDNLFSYKSFFEENFREENVYEVENMSHRLSKYDMDKVKPIVEEILAKKNLFNLY